MDKTYKATIITPFHNTNLSIFKTTVDSVLSQSIGFENIEWIVVLHNCSGEYIEGVKKMLGQYENVVLKELYNSAKSASSPRNYGLQFVTSPYIEFLDSDDTIKPNTVETCLNTMEKHHPDIVVFRMAYIKENESVRSVITDITLWDPLETEIVLTGEETTSRPELYSTINFCTHNRFFDAAFISKHNIRFDESITMAEDAYFTLSCYTLAKKIVVLPQFVGHNYFVNNTSAVQNSSKTPEQILHYSYGFKKIFDMLIEHNAYYNHFFLTILEAYIHFGASCPDFTAKDWKTLQRDMRIYALLITPPPENKFYTKEQGQLLYDFVTNTILKPVDIKKRTSTYRNGVPTLMNILNKNAKTDFGTHYKFNEINSLGTFKKRIPVQSYDDYNHLVELATTVGESQLISMEPIAAYSAAYGFIKRSSSIPIAQSLCTYMGKKFLANCHNEKTFLVVGSMPKKKTENDGAYEDSLLSIVLKSGLGSVNLEDAEQRELFTAPSILLFAQESDETYYLNMLSALRAEDVTQIYAANTWIVSNFLRILCTFGDDLCHDIEFGTISHGNSASHKLGSRFVQFTLKDPERANKIRSALKLGKENILLAIWPKLKMVVARNGANYNIYTKAILSWFENVPLVSGDLYTPFGIIGHGKNQRNTYSLDTDTAFYEFLPLNCEEHQSPVLRTDLKSDQVYELVITNGYGIYRFATGIFIRPLCITSDGLCFEEVSRPLMIGAKPVLYAEAIEQALVDIFENNVRDYYYFVNKENHCLHVLLAYRTDIDADLIMKLRNRFVSDAITSDEDSIEYLKRCRVYLIDKFVLSKMLTGLKKDYQLAADSYMPEHDLISSEIASKLIERIPSDSIRIID